MKASLARRLFRTIFAIGLINVIVTLIAVEFIYEDMEETILQQELSAEREVLERQITGPAVQAWRTAWLTAIYIPDGAVVADMPAMFVDREAPFSAEVDIGEKSYLISIERTMQPPGVLYLAQDVTLLENREDVLQLGMTVLGLGMLLIGALLSRIGTQRIVRPLHDLAEHIAGIRPGTPFARIERWYQDEELASIARTLNELLDALDAYVQREKALVSLASHELRTPVAVIAGALDVLEQRNSLGDSDRATVARIRRASDEMRADVEALLKLARRSDLERSTVPLNLPETASAVIAELEESAPEHLGRITCRLSAPSPEIEADPALIRMLLRNLLQNALRHTPDGICIELAPHGLSITDSGPGIPEHIQRRMSGENGREVPEDGLGLFIVRLICERLGWMLRIHCRASGGTVIDILFLPSAAHTAK